MNRYFLYSIVFVLLICGIIDAAESSVSVTMPDSLSAGFTSNIVRIMLIMTAVSLAPALLIMFTSFTRILIVLSIVRNATGLQQSPPNLIFIGIALFMTIFIMSPVFEQAYHDGIEPLLEERIEESEAINKIYAPFREFMIMNTSQKKIKDISDIAEVSFKTEDDVTYNVLLPAFMISEIHKAFEIGFLIFLPFIIIDLLVASTLMTIGMMMLPPVVISLPFKLLFLVLSDGWSVILIGLVKSFVTKYGT